MPITPMHSIETLKRALEIAEQIANLEAELDTLLNQDAIPPSFSVPAEIKRRKKRRVVSAASRAKMAAAQRARWAKRNAQ